MNNFNHETKLDVLTLERSNQIKKKTIIENYTKAIIVNHKSVNIGQKTIWLTVGATKMNKEFMKSILCRLDILSFEERNPCLIVRNSYFLVVSKLACLGGLVVFEHVSPSAFLHRFLPKM